MYAAVASAATRAIVRTVRVGPYLYCTPRVEGKTILIATTARQGYWLWLKNKDSAPPLARVHLTQTTFVSLWGGLLIISLTALFILVGGLYWEYTWVAVILYFTCIHSTLVLFGMYALIKALAGQPWRFPLIGPRDDRLRPSFTATPWALIDSGRVTSNSSSGWALSRHDDGATITEPWPARVKKGSSVETSDAFGAQVISSASTRPFGAAPATANVITAMIIAAAYQG